jgi:thiamine biosynthesis lipoprotein
MIPGLSSLLLVLAALAALAVLGGCAARAPLNAPLARFEYRRVVMGVEGRIVLYAPSESSAFAAASRGFERLAELNASLSDYLPASELNRIAAGPVGEPQPVGDDLLAVLVASKEVHGATGGAFDVTVGPASRLWRRARDSGIPSDPDAIAAARARIDMSAIRIDKRERTVTIARSDLALDLGGIAKGYAAQQALNTLRHAGVARAMVALAGDIAVGEPPPGRDGWGIAADSGEAASAAPGHDLSIRNACVSTSGWSQQYVEFAGVRFSHIIDPRTGVGSQHASSVTVIGPDGARVDALATALCIAAEAERAAIIARYPAYRVIVHEAE